MTEGPDSRNGGRVIISIFREGEHVFMIEGMIEIFFHCPKMKPYFRGGVRSGS